MSIRTFLMENHEYRTDILQAIEQRLNYMIDRFCRTYIVRLDIRFPQGYTPRGANEECSELLRRLREYYTYHGIVMHYVGVREQHTSNNPHYHIALLFDGAKLDNGWGVWSRAAEIWSRIVGGAAEPCVHLCQPFDQGNGIKIEKPRRKSEGWALQNELAAFETARCSVMRWLLYMAKTETKGCAPWHTREFFCSRLLKQIGKAGWGVRFVVTSTIWRFRPARCPIAPKAAGTSISSNSKIHATMPTTA